jgi:hypothetical protein
MGARFDHDNTSRAEHDQSWPRPLGTRRIPNQSYPCGRFRSQEKIRGKFGEIKPGNFCRGIYFPEIVFPVVATQ